MPLPNYDGTTFVAYIDISGFKSMMERNLAWKALDKFYSIGYEVIKNQRVAHHSVVNGLFVSDCGILFVNNTDTDSTKIDDLCLLLEKIKWINEQMLLDDVMLTCSISYGFFKYQNRIEIQGIGKNPVYGDAYVNAFSDNEYGIPKIQPGFCRFVESNNYPFFETILQNSTNLPFNLITKRKNEQKHLYYYWMLNELEQISEFETDYKESEFIGKIHVLKQRRDSFN